VTLKVRALESYMEIVCKTLNIPISISSETLDTADILEEESSQDAYVASRRTATSSNREDVIDTRIWEMRIDPDTGPTTVPAAYVGEMEQNGQPQVSLVQPDCLSQGVLTADQAHGLFEICAHRLDHYLYRILGESTTLREVRSRSPLPTAAIRTVGVLHSSDLGFLYAPCKKAFVNYCSALLFSTSSNINDIRGLCICTFWLHELSRNLVGLVKAWNDG
jgi:hypothetical protein